MMSTPDFVRSQQDQMIDLRHPLAVLSTRLPWASIEAAVAPKLTHQSLPVKRVIVNSTVPSKAIAHPVNSRLLEIARHKLGAANSVRSARGAS